MPVHFLSGWETMDDGRRRGVHLQCGPHDHVPAICCTAAADPNPRPSLGNQGR